MLDKSTLNINFDDEYSMNAPYESVVGFYAHVEK